MEQIAGMNITPRRVQGPGFELIGVEGEQGVGTAIWLPTSSPCRAEGFSIHEPARAFLMRPAIAGMARLVAADREAQAVVYASGEVWSLAEVAAHLRRRSATPGLRAGIELAWRVADLLSRAEREAQGLGLRGHGAIDPWRLALRADGQVLVLGYGLRTGHPERCCTGSELAEALRYAPPERLTGRPEDGTSDLFSLSLLALEWMVGEPVYSGTPEGIRAQVAEAEGDHRLYTWRERLPHEVFEVFGRAVRRDPDARWPDTTAYRDATRRLLSSPALEGPSLHQLMTAAQLEAPRRFVGLAEERGDVDRRQTAPPPAAETRADPDPTKRYVSLGGRNAGRGRQAEPAPAEGPVPSRARPDAPPPPPQRPPPEPEAPIAPIGAAIGAAPAISLPTSSGAAGPATLWEEQPAPVDWAAIDARRQPTTEIPKPDAARLAKGGAPGAEPPKAPEPVNPRAVQVAAVGGRNAGKVSAADRSTQVEPGARDAAAKATVTPPQEPQAAREAPPREPTPQPQAAREAPPREPTPQPQAAREAPPREPTPTPQAAGEVSARTAPPPPPAPPRSPTAQRDPTPQPINKAPVHKDLGPPRDPPPPPPVSRDPVETVRVPRSGEVAIPVNRPPTPPPARPPGPEVRSAEPRSQPKIAAMGAERTQDVRVAPQPTPPPTPPVPPPPPPAVLAQAARRADPPRSERKEETVEPLGPDPLYGAQIRPTMAAPDDKTVIDDDTDPRMVPPPPPPPERAPAEATPAEGFRKEEPGPRTERRVRVWPRDEEPTRTLTRGDDIIRLALEDPEGRTFSHVIDGALVAAEAIEHIARARGLARNDMLGATVYGWRLSRDGQIVPDDTRVTTLRGAPLYLVRIPNRPVLVGVVVRDPEGDAWLSAAVGTAVPVARIVAWLTQVFALEPGEWSLRVGGLSLHPDALLDGRIDDGGELELVR